MDHGSTRWYPSRRSSSRGASTGIILIVLNQTVTVLCGLDRSMRWRYHHAWMYRVKDRLPGGAITRLILIILKKTVTVPCGLDRSINEINHHA